MTTDPAVSTLYVSTGQLPPGEHVRLLVNEAYERFRANTDGALSRVYPSLATVDPDRFGICVANTRGLTATAGDAEVEFSIMSVAKPFVFALMCSVHGSNTVAQFVGLNATGRAFNSVAAIEDRIDADQSHGQSGGDRDRQHDPRKHHRREVAIHPGGVVAFCGATTVDRRGDLRLRFGDEFDQPRHRGLAAQPRQVGSRSGGDRRPVHTAELPAGYRRDLATMAATLAGGGVHPSTGEQVVDQASCRSALVVMATAGLYETSASGCTPTGCPARAASVAGSSWCHRGRAGWARSRLGSIRPATA